MELPAINVMREADTEPELPLLAVSDRSSSTRSTGTPTAAAAALVATLSEYEKLWCLDGDAPTWAGLKFLGGDGYHKAVFIGGELDRVGFPGIRFSDGPRGAVVGNATAFPVPMARGATWDPDLEERAIIEHCDGKLARYKMPTAVRFVDVVPRNASGKALKRELRLQFPEL